jgi:gluconokinase
VVVLMGPAGAGKSTVGRALASALDWDFVEGDAYHPAGNVALMQSGHALGDEERAPWLIVLRDEIARHLAEGRGAVVACSALRRSYREALRPPASGDCLRFVYLDAPAVELGMRLRERAGHFFPATLLASQLATLEPPADDEHVLVVDAGQPVPEVVTRIRGALGLG